MARVFLNKKDVVELLRQEVKRAGSQTAWAKVHGYDRAVLNTVLTGHREITAPLIKLLKLRMAYVTSSGSSCEILDEDNVLRILREDVERAGSKATWARHNRYSRTSLSLVLSKKRPLTIEIIRALKLKPAYILKSSSAPRKLDNEAP